MSEARRRIDLEGGGLRAAAQPPRASGFVEPKRVLAESERRRRKPG